MRTLKFWFLSLLIPLGFAQSSVIPVPPCTLNFNLSNTSLTSNTLNNNTPSCDKWTVTAYVVGSGSFTLTLQSAPPATLSTPGSWTTYPGTVATGSNPLTATGIATFTNGTTATQFMRLLLNVSSGTAQVYGVLQGSQTVVSKGGGGGGGGALTIAGTASEIGATGAGCTPTNTGTCTISIVNNAALPGAPTTSTATLGDDSTKIATTAFVVNLLAGCVFSSGNFSCPGTITASGFISSESDSGNLQMNGLTSGNVTLAVNDIAGTAIAYVWPSTNGSVGQVIEDNGVTTCPTLPAGAPSVCHALIWTTAPSGTAGGGVLGYSASALTLPAAGTTFLAPAGGAQASATEANVTVLAPAAAPISNVYVNLSSAPGLGNTITVTYRDAGSSTALTCTISGAVATACHDITHSFTPAIGDALSVEVDTTGTVVITPTIRIIAEYGVTGGGGGGGNTITIGACPSLPGSGQTAGNLYQCNDEPLKYIFTSATVAQAFFNDMPVTAPTGICPASGGSFTWVNQQPTGTCSQATNGPFIMAMGTNTNGCCNSQLLVQAAPSTPYSYTTQIASNFAFNDNQSNFSAGFFMGLAIRDSGSGKFSECDVGMGGGVGQGAVRWSFQHWNSPTSTSTQETQTVGLSTSRIGLKLQDDGTNHNCYGSTDGGAHWILLFTESRTAFVPSGGNQTGFWQIIFNSGGGGTGPSQSEFFDYTKGT